MANTNRPEASETDSWSPPTLQFLAFLASGRIFTRLIPGALIVGSALAFLAFLVFWLSRWTDVYQLERWPLVFAFLSQFLQLGFAYFLLRIVWIRAQHLREIPPGEFVTLHAFSLALRLGAEFQLAVAIGVAALMLFAPVVGGLDPLVQAARTINLAPSLAVAAGIGSTAAVGAASILGSVMALFILYAIASAVDTYVRIELNTARIADRS